MQNKYQAYVAAIYQTIAVLALSYIQAIIPPMAQTSVMPQLGIMHGTFSYVSPDPLSQCNNQ